MTERDARVFAEGATNAIGLVDACCLGKAYVTAGIGLGKQLGKGPGPVVHTEFPSLHRHFPSIVLRPTSSSTTKPFFRLNSYTFTKRGDEATPRLGRILPIVETQEWVEQLTQTKGITDIQLRIKDTTDPKEIAARIKSCQMICQQVGVRLWVNDYWEAAIEAGCFGVHIGQEDLVKCCTQGGLEKIKRANLALGISTHSYAELAVAFGLRPSYISLGPVFGTSSKKVDFDAQGLDMVAKWRQLVPPSMPLVVIGGIQNAKLAKSVRTAGADCAAVIGAITKASNVQEAATELCNAMSYRDP